MKRFYAFVYKEILHIFRDKRSLMILFGMPIAQILIFGFVITNEIRNANIAILDLSKDASTQEITGKLLSSGYFRLYKNLNGHEEIHEAFTSGNIRMVIVFEQNFEKNLLTNRKAAVQIIADASDANTANLLSQYAAAIVNDYALNLNPTAGSQTLINAEIRMVFNENLKGVYMFIPGTMTLILMLLSAMMTSISIAREKESGTMEVMLVSPLRPLQIILGKVSPYFLLSFVNALTIIALGVLVFGMPVRGSMLLLLAETMLFILMALSLGILISTLAKTQQVAMFISMFALMLPTMLLSGFIFPIENMPLVLQWLANVLPMKYFIIILKSIMLKGGGFEYVWKETLIIFLHTCLFIVLSSKLFKNRLI
jgi:ABC-2 type transport system permease protein